MGKRGKKFLDAEKFSCDVDHIVVVAESEGYRIGIKERNNSPGCKVWVKRGNSPILSYNGHYRLRDLSRPLAQGLIGLSTAEASAMIETLLPRSVHRLVLQVWEQRDQLWCDWCAKIGHESDPADEWMVPSGLMLGGMPLSMPA